MSETNVPRNRKALICESGRRPICISTSVGKHGFLLNRSAGVRNTGVSPSVSTSVKKASTFSRSTQSSSRTTRPSRLRFWLFWHCSHQPCPFGQNGLSIATVFFPVDVWPVRLLYSGTGLEAFAIGILCHATAAVLEHLAAHLRVSASLDLQAAGASFQGLAMPDCFSLCSSLRTKVLVSSGSPIGSSASNSIVRVSWKTAIPTSMR